MLARVLGCGTHKQKRTRRADGFPQARHAQKQILMILRRRRGAPLDWNAAGFGDGVEPGGNGDDGEGRKPAVPWTEEEHRTFLAGLERLGKGDWRGIAKNFVTTRTPTQVASHAQKYFLRQTNPNKKKRRSSLFDTMASHLSPAPNCPILPPSVAKVHEMVSMTKQLQNSSLEGVSSTNAANLAPQVARDLPPPAPSFKATNVDTSLSKTNHMNLLR